MTNFIILQIDIDLKRFDIFHRGRNIIKTFGMTYESQKIKTLFFILQPYGCHNIFFEHQWPVLLKSNVKILLLLLDLRPWHSKMSSCNLFERL